MNHIAWFDFNGLYEDLRGVTDPGEGLLYHHIDCYDISGTRGYCTPEAGEEILRRCAEAGMPSLAAYHNSRFDLHPLIRVIDNGNYHYLSHLLMRDIREPFALVLIDHHPDLRPPAFLRDTGAEEDDTKHALLSCGGWVLSSLQQNRQLRQVIMIGVDEALWEEETKAAAAEAFVYKAGRRDNAKDTGEEGRQTSDTEEAVSVRRIASDTEEAANVIDKMSELLPAGMPLYLSIDKDVLLKEALDTNWDQGQMRLALLHEIVKGIAGRFRLLAVDICGAPEAHRASALQMSANRRIDEMLISVSSYG